MEKLATLQDLVLHELHDLYSAEKQIAAALPGMIEAAHSDKLAEALSDHLVETQVQLKRLERCFRELGSTPNGAVCIAMKGLIAEGSKLIAEQDSIDPAVLDAALIGATQKIEHYEIGSYGTLRTFCEQLGFEKCAELLQDNLDEEIATDEVLSQLAIGEVNLMAEAGGMA